MEPPLSYLFIFKKYSIYLLRERERERGRGRSRLHEGSPMWDSIPGPRDMSQPRAGAQPLSHPGIPILCFLHGSKQSYLTCKHSLYICNLQITLKSIRKQYGMTLTAHIRIQEVLEFSFCHFNGAVLEFQPPHLLDGNHKSLPCRLSLAMSSISTSSELLSRELLGYSCF